jgi:hypothetical protein
MQVSLPSGEKVELRTSLRAKDKFAVQAAISANDGSVNGGVLSLMETALLARLIESWSLEVEMPSKHACPGCTGNSVTWHEHVRDEFGEALDLDDFNALEKEISPLLAKVLEAPNLETSSSSAASS